MTKKPTPAAFALDPAPTFDPVPTQDPALAMLPEPAADDAKAGFADAVFAGTPAADLTPDTLLPDAAVPFSDDVNPEAADSALSSGPEQPGGADVPGADIVPALDLSRLSYLERYIERMNFNGYRTELKSHLHATADLVVIENADGIHLQMEGVTIDPAADMATALANWAAAARRAIMQAVA